MSHIEPIGDALFSSEPGDNPPAGGPGDPPPPPPPTYIRAADYGPNGIIGWSYIQVD